MSAKPVPASPIASLLAALHSACPAIRSIWMIGERAASPTPYSAGPALWDLIAFANAASLERVRGATNLHRDDVRLRVVIDGDRFGTAWGGTPSSGSLFHWQWVQASEAEAFYSEARWSAAATGIVERVRRRALCLSRAPGQ